MKVWMLAGGLCVAAGFSVAVFAADDVIAQRKALMKANGAAAKTASEMINGTTPFDAAAAAAAARKIASDLETFPTLFPEGSDQGDTTAAPAIWTNMDGFKAAAAKTVADANAAADAAAQGADAFKTAFAVVGGDCGSCHREFRIKK